MNRIEAIYSFIDLKDRVVDVGCDQAKLGILLAKRNQKSIASDISPKVIERASLDIRKLGLDNLIDLRVSNGLQNINLKQLYLTTVSKYHYQQQFLKIIIYNSLDNNHRQSS